MRQVAERFRQAEEVAPEVSDERMALAALLVHVARVDGVVAASERDRLVALLAERFALGPAAARMLVNRADAADRASGDIEHFVDLAKRGLDHAARLQLIGLAWEVAKADGRIHEFEDDLIWRAAQLLDLDESAAAGARAAALAEGTGAAA
ncbi:TerB family tellurite resistance protein [Chelatococcus sp. SYSU_G07232]|uniref:TerB family tellurite resistance protein n=1 Tax=Chelatococcus albus TaxID=3047466 RepID=A0ABT7AEQ3_9HYPH|nr:TerB family tellurite resistance protein [Chelatococcus sp. SYSU_G07232]MDJ1157329.1 TerB family tellurite resistance protein [Chelatococcus sp. SYSU_G07232]